MLSLGSALGNTGRLFTTDRKLWVPFLIGLAAEIFCLLAIWLAPQQPFSTVLAPPIRYFFSDRVLHYPWHIWFLYHAMKHTHLIAATLIGAFMTGIACAMVGQQYAGKPLSFRDALMGRQVKYGRLVLVWLITWGVAQGVLELVSAKAPREPWVMWASIGGSIILQTFLVYAIPAAVFDNLSWWRALGRGIAETFRAPFSTLMVVLIPSSFLVVYAMIAPPSRVAEIGMRTAPEVILAFVAVRLLLWMVSDAFMTVASAHLWQLRRSPAAVRATARPSPKISPQRKAAVVVAALSLLALATTAGCSRSYNGERLFWQAQRLSASIAEDPKKATPQDYRAAEAAFQKVISGAPGSTWAGKAQLAIGSLHALQKDFEKARAAYTLVLQNHSNQKDVALSARYAIAKTFEVEEKWDEAVKMYDQIADFHTWSRMGLEAPLYIGAIYQKINQRQQATAAFERAVRAYTKLIPQSPTPQAQAQVKGYLGAALQQLGKWPEAVAVLEEMSVVEGVNRPLILMSMGSMYQARLSDPEKAKASYLKVMQEFPQHELAKVARERLIKLGVPAESLPALPETPAAGAEKSMPDLEPVMPAAPAVPTDELKPAEPASIVPPEAPAQ